MAWFGVLCRSDVRAGRWESIAKFSASLADQLEHCPTCLFDTCGSIVGSRTLVVSGTSTQVDKRTLYTRLFPLFWASSLHSILPKTDSPGMRQPGLLYGALRPRKLALDTYLGFVVGNRQAAIFGGRLARDGTAWPPAVLVGEQDSPRPRSRRRMTCY
jgi:hypothetical protein